MRAGTIYYLLIDKTIKAPYLLMLVLNIKTPCSDANMFSRFII